MDKPGGVVPCGKGLPHAAFRKVESIAAASVTNWLPDLNWKMALPAGALLSASGVTMAYPTCNSFCWPRKYRGRRAMARPAATTMIGNQWIHVVFERGVFIQSD